jgi:hypothetical protein
VKIEKELIDKFVESAVQKLNADWVLIALMQRPRRLPKFNGALIN